MPGNVPEVSGGMLDGRTSDSASESDRNRFKTDTTSGRKHDSWSINTNPRCDGRAPPNTKTSGQHPKPVLLVPSKRRCEECVLY
jgi:hypothetical protein